MGITKQVSLHGIRAFLSKDDELVGRGAIATGGVNKPSVVLPGSPDVVAIFDDLVGRGVDGIGDTGFAAAHHSTPFFAARVADTGANVAIQTTTTNGVIRLHGDHTATTATASFAMLVGQHTWKANMGPGALSGRLRMGARIKCSTTADAGKGANSWSAAGIWVGFADTGVLGAGNFPFYDTGDGQPTDTGQLHQGTIASNAAGFYYGENCDTGIRGITISSGTTAGSNDSGEAEVLLTSTNPAANKWQVWEVELSRGLSDTGGTATFYIDGVAKGSLSLVPQSDMPLVPCVGMFAADTGAPLVEVDWINVSAPRDTGL